MNSPQHRSWHNELLSHQQWLRSILRARLGDPHVVDDVSNDVMADALAIREPAERIKLPAPWLYRLAIRKTLLFRRKCGRRNRAYRAQAEDSRRVNRNQVATPLENMLEEERKQTVRDAMLRLNGQDSEILLLKYVHDWDYDTISDNLGIDYWKVVHRLRRARERLRMELADLIP